MASVQGPIPRFCVFRACSGSCSPRSFPSLSVFPQKFGRKFNRLNPKPKSVKEFQICRVMVQQTAQGSSGTYAKEMERLSAKEALLLAFQGAGGFEALVEGKVTNMQRIEVMERITVLERLNPTPRPTTSPYLEGKWNFEWFGSGSPASSAVRSVLERFPTTLASLSKMDVLLKDTYAKVTAYLRLLNSVEIKLILSSKFSIEGPLRIKEEYFEGLLEPPIFIEESVPEQLRSALGQAVGTVQQLAAPIRDALSSGIRFPLSGDLQRVFVISYLDEEILIIRDVYGVPEVLTRWDVPPSLVAQPAIEYES